MSARCSQTKAQTENTSVVDLPTARVHRLQQLIHLIITHLLSKVGQNCDPPSALPRLQVHRSMGRRRRTVSKLPHTNEARHILVEHLKASTVFFWLARVSESARSIQDFLEGVEVDCCYAKYHILAMFLPSLSRSNFVLIVAYNHLQHPSPNHVFPPVLDSVRMPEGDRLAIRVRRDHYRAYRRGRRLL